MTDIDLLSTDFARSHPSAFARILSRATTRDITLVLEHLAPDVIASVVSRLAPTCIDDVLAAEHTIVQQWLIDAQISDAVALIGRIPRKQGLAMVDSIPGHDRRRKLLQYLNYPSHSVGSLVTDVRLRISSELTAVEALQEMRRLNMSRPGPVVVLHNDGRYSGLLNTWLLMTQDPPPGIVRDYVLHVPPLHPETSLSSAAHEEGWHKYNWLPVVDQDEHLLGGVTRSEVFTAADRESGEQRQRTDVFATVFTQLIKALSRLVRRVLVRRTAT